MDLDDLILGILDEAKKKKRSCAGCKGKSNLWCNICRRRKAGKPRRKPGQKGYPKTLKIESLLREFINEALSGADESQIESLMEEPEFESLDTFIKMKLDNDEFEYTFIELQALARNLTLQRTSADQVTTAAPVDVKKVREYLEDEMGFQLVQRAPEKSTRGFTSSAHGTHPFAGSGGGGSGFSTDFSGGGFTSFGGGPGAVGGGYKWDPNDPRNLGMAAKRKQ